MNDKMIKNALNPLGNINIRKVIGGPSPSTVLKHIEYMNKKLNQDNNFIEANKKLINEANEKLYKKLYELM
jgi:hypothetical protein